MSIALKVLTYPNKILAQKCEGVKNFDSELQHIVETMLITMYAEAGIGLAANQVGILKRIIVIDTGLPEEFLKTSSSQKLRGVNPLILINPRIRSVGNTSTYIREGCLSFPGIRQKVKRYVDIEVSYQDLTGKSHKDFFSGLNAICIQHEVDHLNGITLADKMSSLKKQKIRRRFNE